jgi:hypothetical protein
LSETTTTDEQVDTSADQTTESQAEQTTEATAEATQTQDQTDPQGTDESATVADQNVEWLKNKGIDPSDPQALSKAAAMYREAERAMHESNQNRKNLQTELGEDDEQTLIDPNVAAFGRQVTELRFYQDHPEAKGREDEIIAVAKDYPELGKAYNLQALWEIVQGRSASAAIKAAEKKGSEQTRQDIARASIAGAPRGSASATKIADKTEDEARRERFSNW